MDVLFILMSRPKQISFPGICHAERYVSISEFSSKRDPSDYVGLVAKIKTLTVCPGRPGVFFPSHPGITTRIILSCVIPDHTISWFRVVVVALLRTIKPGALSELLLRNTIIQTLFEAISPRLLLLPTQLKAKLFRGGGYIT